MTDPQKIARLMNEAGLRAWLSSPEQLQVLLESRRTRERARQSVERAHLILARCRLRLWQARERSEAAGRDFNPGTGA